MSVIPWKASKPVKIYNLLRIAKQIGLQANISLQNGWKRLYNYHFYYLKLDYKSSCVMSKITLQSVLPRMFKNSYE